MENLHLAHERADVSYDICRVVELLKAKERFYMHPEAINRTLLQLELAKKVEFKTKKGRIKKARRVTRFSFNPVASEFLIDCECADNARLSLALKADAANEFKIYAASINSYVEC